MHRLLKPLSAVFQTLKTTGLRAMSESVLPPPPRQPDESECCNSDCVLCVKDIYEQELKIWKQECQDILLKNVTRSQMSPDAYTRCELIDISQVTHNAYLYTFDSNGYVEIKSGQHLILREEYEGKRFTRQYTPVAVPEPENLRFKVLIKLYEEGLMSKQIRLKWRPGYHAEWRGPHGLFVHEANKYSKYLLLAAGTGCAPMVSVARRVVEDDNDITVLKLLYANRTYEDIIFKAELKELARNWNFTYRHHLSQDPDADKKKAYSENVSTQRIDLTAIKGELSSPSSTRVLICGTRDFDAAMLTYLTELGVPHRNIFKF